MKLYKKVLQYVNENSKSGPVLRINNVIRGLKLKEPNKLLESIAYLEINGLIEVHRTMSPDLEWLLTPLTKGIAYKLFETPWYKNALLISWIAIFISVFSPIITPAVNNLKNFLIRFFT